MKTTNSRAIAATILADLLAGKGSLDTHLRKHKELPDASLLQETLYGSCRWFHLLEHIVGTLLNKPLKRKDSDLKCLLIIGVYQLRYLSTPEYAVLNETVAAAHSLGKGWAKGLVNAVLRNYLRGADEIEASIATLPPAVASSHPDWFFAAIAEQWPEARDSILAANNSRPPMTLRVNLSRTTRDGVLREFAAAGIDAAAGQLAPTSIYLTTPSAVDALPGFAEGLISVQDEASQLVAGLLQLQPGLRVLDACAAPGGKTCHILESEPLLTGCTALDIDASRLTRISENLDRLGLSAQLIAANGAEPARWWDKKYFDRILLDAPCSATGVVRRHPDIKVLRNKQQVEKLIQTQRALLLALWPCLNPGGLFLYTSCSVLREENEANIAWFLETTANAKYESIAADWGVECRYGRQLLPSAGPDGFYYALLRKN